MPVSYTVKRPLKRPPTHPGELMHEILTEHFKVSVAEAAQRMSVSRQSLYAVLRGDSAVTAEMALLFGRLVDAAPELYLHMQDRFSLWRAQQRLGDKLVKVDPVRERA